MYRTAYHTQLNNIILASDDFVSEDFQEDLSDFLDSVVEDSREEGYSDGYSDGRDCGFEDVSENLPDAQDLRNILNYLEEKLSENWNRYDVAHYNKITKYIDTMNIVISVRN